MSKLIWATGVSCVDGNEYLKSKFLPLCEQRGKKVKIIYPGDMIFEAQGILLPKNNILHVSRELLEERMWRVFEKIERDIEKHFSDYDAIIIKTHKWFKSRGFFIRAHAAECIMKFDLDRMVTFIDGIANILNRLKQKQLFDFEGITKDDICDWQTVEVESTQEIAEIMKKPFSVIPSGENPELLYHLIFNPDVEPVYVAIDITNSNEVLKKKVDRFVEKARKFFPCFLYPYAVPLDYQNRDRREDSHIVNMCLDWFVRQSEIIIGYYPVEMESNGKPNEIRKGYELGKDVYIVYLPAKPGPFEEHFKTQPIFRTEERFFKFLKQRSQI